MMPVTKQLGQLEGLANVMGTVPCAATAFFPMTPQSVAAAP